MDNVEVERRRTYSQIDRHTRHVGVPTAQHNLRPKTRPVPYSDIRPGDIIMESTAHPVRVVKRSGVTVITLAVLYVWQSDSEAAWPMGPLAATDTARKAVTRRGAR